MPYRNPATAREDSLRQRGTVANITSALEFGTRYREEERAPGTVNVITGFGVGCFPSSLIQTNKLAETLMHCHHRCSASVQTSERKSVIGVVN